MHLAIVREERVVLAVDHASHLFPSMAIDEVLRQDMLEFEVLASLPVPKCRLEELRERRDWRLGQWRDWQWPAR